MLERILCPSCKQKVLNERVTTGGKFFICSCGYDSRNKVRVAEKTQRTHTNLSAQSSSELISQLVFLEEECKKMQNEIYQPDKLEEHIKILPKIYENLKIILQ